MSQRDISSEEEFFHRNKIQAQCGNNNRVIVFLDVDCYEYQLWKKIINREDVGRNDPGLVINPDNIILAVNYAARILGITRKMHLERAKELCFKQSGRHLVVLPAGIKDGLVDTETPMQESDKILRVLRNFKESSETRDVTIQKSTIDKFYIDVTDLVFRRMSIMPGVLPEIPEVELLALSRKENCPDPYAGEPVVILEGRDQVFYLGALMDRIKYTHAYTVYWDNVHYINEIKLVHGALIAQILMENVLRYTGYECSFGVGGNKLTAKMACGLNKPKGITIIPGPTSRLLRKLKIQNLPGYGGPVGEELCKRYQIHTLHDVSALNPDSLARTISEINTEKNPWAEALDLLRKAELNDSDVVHTCYYFDTIQQLISFKGRYTVCQWNHLQQDIGRLSRRFVSKLHYHLDTHNRFATSSSVRVTLKSNKQVTIRSRENILEIPRGRLPFENEIYRFVLDFIYYQRLWPDELDEISLKASGFEHRFKTD